MSITIITDGSADNKKGMGGWAALVRSSTTLIELTGWEEGTTSNRMELLAAIEGLRSIQTPSDVTIVTDSAYVLNTMRNQWYERWFEGLDRVGNPRVKPRPNLDLWHQLVGLCHFHNVSWVKVKGHSGDYWNDRADRLADRARREKVSMKLELSNGSRCDTMSYGKQCYLYAGHSGDCRWGKEYNGIQPATAEAI